VSLLGTILCVIAAYRLRATPLFAIAAATAGINAAAVSAALVMHSRGRAPGRALTALGHVTAALAGFFLFVSFAMPDAPQ